MMCVPDAVAVLPQDPTTPIHILVVEDEPPVRISIARSLQMHGYQVTCAESGEEAIRLIDGATTQFDLVISDVVMRGMSGVTLGTQLRARPTPVTVMLMSGYPGSHFSDQPSTFREFALLEKPFTPAELAARVKECLPRTEHA
jgi:DNA-binding response OmpR family regulator